MKSEGFWMAVLGSKATGAGDAEKLSWGSAGVCVAVDAALRPVRASQLRGRSVKWATRAISMQLERTWPWRRCLKVVVQRRGRVAPQSQSPRVDASTPGMRDESNRSKQSIRPHGRGDDAQAIATTGGGEGGDVAGHGFFGQE
jgi:hypothetical protein